MFWRIAYADAFDRRWAAATLPIRRRQPEQSLRSQGRHSDGNATAPPDSAVSPVVFPGCYVFTTHSLRCGCAGRSYRSHSTSQLLQSHGSEAHDANETRPSGIKLAPVAYGYEPVVCAKKIHQTLRIRTVNARPDGLTRDSSSERPLPADLCGLRSQQAACSLCCACGMHVRSWRLLDCSWKAAAGGICVRYHRDRAIPTTTAAQNGLLGHRYGGAGRRTVA